jgi:hypothetical protein
VIGKPFVPDPVSRAFRVLTAIGFDNQATLTADEIDRIGSERLLPNEFKSV